MFPTAEIAGFDLISQNSPSLIFCFLRSRHWSGRLAFLLFNIDAAISPTCITFASSLCIGFYQSFPHLRLRHYYRIV